MTTRAFSLLAVALLCAAGFVAVGVGAPASPHQGEDWRTLIVSRNVADWERAVDIVRQERRATVAALLTAIDRPVSKGEPFVFRTPRNAAIGLLGELRAAEAVPALIGWLGSKPGQSHAGYAGALPPAEAALIEIGNPAVPALLDILASTGVSSEPKGEYVHELRDGVGYTRYVGPPLEHVSRHGDMSLLILVGIKGLEETEAGLRRWVAAESDPTRKKNLQDALEALSRPSLRNGFEKMQADREAQERHEWAGWWTRQEQEKKAQQQTVGQQPAEPAPPREGTAAPPAGPTSPAAPPAFSTTYDAFAKRLLTLTGVSRDRTIAQYRIFTIKGEGWVASAVQEGDGWVVKLRADQTVPGQAPITLTVLPKDAQGKAMPTVGEKVSYAGRLDTAEVLGDRVLVTLIEAKVGPAADK
jgi:hypothetical protein